MATVTLESKQFTAFAGTRLIGGGSLREVVEQTWAHLEKGGEESIAIFDDATGNTVEVDFRGSLAAVLARLPEEQSDAPERRIGPGRPKLGVVSREVSLLPRHWEWLTEQPGGASVALRKLVEVARKENAGKDRARRCRDATHKFMWAMAGDFEGFEEACRAFFAADYARFDQIIRGWPVDIRDHARRLVQTLIAAEQVLDPVEQPADAS
jgi:uncharacterized protein